MVAGGGRGRRTPPLFLPPPPFFLARVTTLALTIFSRIPADRAPARARSPAVWQGRARVCARDWGHTRLCPLAWTPDAPGFVLESEQTTLDLSSALTTTPVPVLSLSLPFSHAGASTPAGARACLLCVCARRVCV